MALAKKVTKWFGACFISAPPEIYLQYCTEHKFCISCASPFFATTKSSLCHADILIKKKMMFLFLFMPLLSTGSEPKPSDQEPLILTTAPTNQLPCTHKIKIKHPLIIKTLVFKVTQFDSKQFPFFNPFSCGVQYTHSLKNTLATTLIY